MLRSVTLHAILWLSGVYAAAVTPGLVNISSASLRSEPSHAAELETQAVYGTPVEILNEDEISTGWLRVRLPDGYEAYIPESSVWVMSEAEMDRWRDADRLIISRPFPGPVIADTLLSDYTPYNRICDLTVGSILEGSMPGPGARFVEVTLPDGDRGYARVDDMADFRTWASRPADIDEVLDVANLLLGIPYLWGGITEKGLDCSGFTRTCYLIGARTLLPRNASQQAMIGTPLDIDHPELFEQGDLIFFGSDGRITHVAIYDHGSTYIHASGKVFRSSFDPQSDKYLPRSVIAAVRPLDGSEPISLNPRYFNR